MPGYGGKKVKLPSKRAKRLLVKVMMFCLGRAFPSLVKMDEELQREVSFWPEGFTIVFEVWPNGPYMSMQRSRKGIEFLGLKKASPDLLICVKNIDSAVLLFTGAMGTPQAYAENRVCVQGHVSDALRLVRCLNRVLFYLFPAFMARRVMKRFPKLELGRLLLGRTKAYILGVPFGV